MYVSKKARELAEVGGEIEYTVDIEHKQIIIRSKTK